MIPTPGLLFRGRKGSVPTHYCAPCKVRAKTKAEAEAKTVAQAKEREGKEMLLQDGTRMCKHCEVALAEIFCDGCWANFCASCNEGFHRAPRMKRHASKEMVQPKQPLCDYCQAAYANVKCEECSKVYCCLCNVFVHKAPNYASHTVWEEL